MFYVLRSFKRSKQNEDHTNAFPYDSVGQLQKLQKLLKVGVTNSAWKLCHFPMMRKIVRTWLHVIINIVFSTKFLFKKLNLFSNNDNGKSLYLKGKSSPRYACEHYCHKFCHFFLAHEQTLGWEEYIFTLSDCCCLSKSRGYHQSEKNMI